MAIYKNVSSKQVIRKILRDLQPASTDFIHDAVEWFGEALEHIGASGQLCTKHCVVDIVDHRGCLPPDLYYIDQVAINTCISGGTSSALEDVLRQQAEIQEDLSNSYNTAISSVSLSKTTSTANKSIANTSSGLASSSTSPSKNLGSSSYNSSLSSSASAMHAGLLNRLRDINVSLAMLQGQYFAGDGSCLCPISYGTGTFNQGMHCDKCVNQYATTKATYVVDCGMFKTSFAYGKLCVSYKAFPVDENCWPMIPDDISYREAMFWYVYKKMILQGVVFKNKEFNYALADQQWKYYCTQARNAANYPDLPRAESFMDQWVRLTPNMNRDITFYQDLNTREQFTRDNY